LIIYISNKFFFKLFIYYYSNRRLKIEIKNEVIKDEDNDTQEALSKIATRVPSLLQDNTNTLSRNTIARRR